MFCAFRSPSKTTEVDGLIFVTESDWKSFCEEWGCIEEKCVSAEIKLRNTEGNNLAGCSDDMQICEEDLGNSNLMNSEVDSRSLVIWTCPEICEECIGEKESRELMRKLEDCNEDIYVYLVHGKEAPNYILQASETSFDPDRCASKRSRKTNTGDQINLKVSGSSSIYKLKFKNDDTGIFWGLFIMFHIGIPIRNALSCLMPLAISSGVNKFL